METDDKFKAWAVLELFGHTRLAGLVSEAQIGGSSFVRIDVPEVAPHVETEERKKLGYSDRQGRPPFTKFYGPGAVYAISPCTEEVARAVAATIRAVPIDAFDITSLVKQYAAANRAALPDRSYEEEP